MTLIVAAGCDKGDSATPNGAQAEQAGALAGSGQGAATAGQAAGADVNKDRYALGASAEPVTVGEPSEVVLSIKAADGLEINHEFPWSIQFTDSEGLSIPQKDVNKEGVKLGETVAEVPLTVSASTPGKHVIEGVGNFSVCNDTQCYVIRNQKLAFNIEAAAPDAPGAEKVQ